MRELEGERARWRASALQRRRLSRLLFGSSPLGATTIGEDFTGFPLHEVFRQSVGAVARASVGRRLVADKDLSAADAREAWFDRVVFDGCSFAEADFSGAVVKRSEFRRCRFRATLFEDMDWGGPDTVFTDCVFDSCRFEGRLRLWVSTFRSTRFVDCRLSNVDFGQSPFHGCSFSGRLESVQFAGPNAPHKQLPSTRDAAFDVDFREADLRDLSPTYGVDLAAARWPPTHRLLRDTGRFLRAYRERVDPAARPHVDELLRILLIEEQPQWVLSEAELQSLAPQIAGELWQEILEHTTAQPETD